MENQSITGASLLLQAMRSSSVDTVFSLSGNQIMPVYDACIDTDVRLVSLWSPQHLVLPMRWARFIRRKWRKVR